MALILLLIVNLVCACALLLCLISLNRERAGRLVDDNGHRLLMRELQGDLADERERVIQALKENAKQAHQYADRLAELRREGFTAGGGPKPAPPPDWDPRVVDFLGRLADPTETENWVAMEVQRQIAKRGDPDWDVILHELFESTVERMGA